MPSKLDRKFQAQIVTLFISQLDIEKTLRRWRKRISPETLELAEQLRDRLSKEWIGTTNTAE